MVVGWVQHGLPQWGNVQECAERIVVDNGTGQTKKLKQTDIAITVPGTLEEVQSIMASSTQTQDAEQLWQRLATDLQETFTVADAAKQLGVSGLELAVLWQHLWLAPECFARVGRTKFRLRTPQEREAEKQRLQQRRQEESLLQTYEQFRVRQAEGKLDRQEILQAPEPEWRSIMRYLAYGEPIEDLSEHTIARMVKFFHVVYESQNSPWPESYMWAQELGEVDAWQHGDPLLQKHQQWLDSCVNDKVDPVSVTTLQPQTALWAIDDAGTQDRDDAFGVLEVPGEFIVEIAIADVSGNSFLTKQNLDHLATVATSTYLPTATIPLLPPHLGMNYHSLSEAQARPVKLIRFRIDSNSGSWKSPPELESGLLKLAGTASYAQIDTQKNQPHTWATAKQLAELLYQTRRNNGAGDIRRPDVSINVESGYPTGFVRREPWKGARAVVRELMILANTGFAYLLKQAKIAAPFRTMDGNSQPLYTRVTTTPAPHEGIGVLQYVYATSPIRRFIDIIAQHQLTALTTGNPMSQQQIEHWITVSEPAFTLRRRWMELALKYWKLRYLEAYPDLELIAEPAPLSGGSQDYLRVRISPLDLLAYLPADTVDWQQPFPVRLEDVDADKGVFIVTAQS
ncbi:exoribonuclease 2-like [Ylistrum balloti]|uniref:exoribonuclease 2-like n=1 Tax=Ylistrum balloti TaxID=509963 RepID=UPI002905C768|nr:exoribonuclease 2-like [Ylistrum balloti]